MILAANAGDAVEIAVPARRSPFWQGLTTEVLNPKTALFFIAFIPQFVSRQHGHVFWQFLLLGTISVALNTSCDLVVTFLAAPIGARLTASSLWRRRQRAATGLVLIGLGAAVAVADNH
jgi:threonine/homoserine/homoserine lactone efflux protein